MKPAHVLLVTLSASCASPQPPRAPAADPPFDVAQVRADMRFLASDLLEGRRAGTHGYDVAAEYVASRLAVMGIAAGGPDGYFQPVRLREVVPDLAATTAVLSDPGLAAAIRVPDSALVNADLAHLDLELSGPMTYVGKGVCDVDSGRDDAAGVALAGRFAVTLAGVADGLPPARAAVRSDTAAKWACVARHGAIGLVVLRTRKATVLPWASTVASYRSGVMGLLDGDNARSRSLPAPILVIDAPAARAALATAGRDLDAEEARAAAGPLEHFELPGTLRIRYRGRARDLVSANVIGGERVEVAAPALLLWAPRYVSAERVQHRAAVAVELDAASAWHDGAPELWLDGKPYVFLRATAVDHHAWLREHLSGRDVWFTYDGASLHSFLGVGVDDDGLLVVDIARVAG